MIALLLGNLFGSFLFALDEHNVYSRQPLGYIFYVHLIGAYIASIILYYRFRRTHGKAQFFPIWMFITPLFLSILIQVPFYGISVSYLGCTIGLIGLYMNIQSKMSLVDVLTGLYNRAYIEHAMARARRNRRFVYSGIMLDLDDFKQVNDSFGHSVGDSALIDAARLLMKSADRDSEVFRYAGDEFIVLVKVPEDNAEKLQAKTLETEKRIRENAAAFSSSNKASYKLVFSMGHAMLGPAITDDQFFRIMDEEMYRDKQKHKEQRN
jgi:diguanylate cyclase (GGDEF)-like protein